VTRPRRRRQSTHDGDEATLLLRVILTGFVFVVIEIADSTVLGNILPWWASLLLAAFLVGGGSVLIIWLDD
jgi:hypothetical protein